MPEWTFTCAVIALPTASPKLCDNPHISFAALTAQCISSKHLSVTDSRTLGLKSDTILFSLVKGGGWNMNTMLRLRVSLLSLL